jgi:hypothetical protein
MNSKTLTLAGAVILIIGLFLPIASVMGISTNLIMPPGQGVTASGLILAGCAVLAAILALIGQPKWAVIPGIGAVGWLVFQYLEAQKQLSGGGDMPPEAQEMLAAMAPSLNYLGWGVMALGAVLILVGGAMGFKSSPPSAA